VWWSSLPVCNNYYGLLVFWRKLRAAMLKKEKRMLVWMAVVMALESDQVAFRPGKPMFDSTGNQIDSHGGGFLVGSLVRVAPSSWPHYTTTLTTDHPCL
jgi:hypothetical protein